MKWQTFLTRASTKNRPQISCVSIIRIKKLVKNFGEEMSILIDFEEKFYLLSNFKSIIKSNLYYQKLKKQRIILPQF